MSINKNFVVKNGLEISTDLIIADANTRKVGIGTTVPQYTLHVNGGIGVTNAYVSGITTVINELRVGTGGTIFSVIAGPAGVGQSVGVGTANPAFLLDIRSPVSTGQTALYVQGDVRITGDLSVDDITFDDATLSNLTVTEALNVTSPGISTFGGYVDINNSVDISGTLNVSGITTLGSYVDINNSVDVSGALNVVGLSTLGGYVDINNSVDVSGALNVVGLSTLGGYVDINNSVDISNNLNVTGIATIATVDINAGEIDVTRIGTGDLNVTGIATIATISVVGAALSNLTVTGISTLGTVRISSGIITATSGIVTYFGDGQYLNLSNSPYKGIGIGTTGGLVGYGITFLDLKGAGVSTTFYNSSVGIATIFFEGGGGSGSIGIGSTFTGGAANGDLFYHIDYGRIFVYYDEVVLGIGTDAFWVDAAPFNVGIITALSNVSFSPGSAVAPSMFFIGDNQTGFFSPGTGQFTVVSSGSSVLNVNASGIRVTGVTTITNASGTVTIGIGTTALLVEGNARVTGILTVGSSSITLNGTTNTINVGTGLTLSSGGINITGVITATSFSGNGSGLTGAGIGTTGSVNTSGIITASSFSGNGSGLTGVAATTLTIGAGSTALPSISPTGDSNTGIFFPSADTIAFAEGGAEALRVDSSGRLLVGTFTSSSYAGLASYFQLEKSGGADAVASIWYNNNDAIGPYLILGKSRGTTAGSNTVVSSGDVLGTLAFFGADGTDRGQWAAHIRAEVDGTPGDNDMPGRLVFSTTADGAASPTERMRISSQGQAKYTTSTTADLLADYYCNGGAIRTLSFEETANTGGVSGTAGIIRVSKNDSNNRSVNATGTINASGADYAEYMTKSGIFDIAKGAICGVNTDGLLTLNYGAAVNFAIKSTNPSYVGNDTWCSAENIGKEPDIDDVDALSQWKSRLEAARINVDRVAFAGQVPVNVTGATPGQYIVPVESADGGIEGIAKDEADLTLTEYMRAIGKVIAIEDDGRARVIVKVA